MNVDQKSDLILIEPYLKAWGENLFTARTEKNLDLIDLSRQLIVSKNQLAAIESGSVKPFHNVFFYLQALKKYQTLLNIELIPDPKKVLLQPGKKSKKHNLKDKSLEVEVGVDVEIDAGNSAKNVVKNKARNAAKLSHLKTTKNTYLSNPRFKKKTIQFSLLGVLSVVILIVAIILLREPAEMIQNNVARLNAEVVSEPIAPVSTAPTIVLTPLTDLAANPFKAEAVTSAPPLTLAKPSDTNPLTLPTNVNMLRLTFTGACWVQAIDKNDVKIEKIFNAGTQFEQPIKNIKSLVIGNASAAQASLGGKKIDLSLYKNSQSSTARLFEKDFASMQ